MNQSSATGTGGGLGQIWGQKRGQLRGPVRLAAMAALGATAALGQAPWGIWPLTILALGIAFAGLRDGHREGPKNRQRDGPDTGKIRRPGAAFSGGWALGVGYFGVALHWIVDPFYIDMARTGWMAPFAVVFMASGMALFWGAGALLARALGRGRIGLWGLVAGFGSVEILRALAFTGFPWGLVGHIWIGTPIAQLAAFIGPHGLSFITLGLAACVALLARRGRAMALAGMAALLGAGMVAMAAETDAPTPPVAGGPIIRLVQPNADQQAKWQPGMAQEFFDRLLRLTRDGAVPDLVIWPETAVQFLLNTAQIDIDAASQAARGAPLITGIVRQDGDGYYNSLVVVGPGGAVTDLYDKWHLVPFGEYFPYAGLFENLGLGALPGLVGGGFASGPGPRAVAIPGIGPATALICYEGIFAEEVNAVATRPRLIVLITNDAWFGNWAGPAQHFAQARLRAIEQGLPLVRVANTGISGMIDPRGRILGALPLGAEGALDLVLPPALAAPAYTRWGDSPAFALALLLAATSWFGAKRRFTILS